MKELINKALKIYKDYKMPILYIFFGGLTTLINIAVYSLFYYFVKIGNIPSNIVAWILAVFFAFVTNKLYVFESKSGSVWYELATFLVCRAGTGLLDLGIMYLSVDVLKLNELIMKILSNVIVIVLNYVFSKLIIFKKKAQKTRLY